MNIHIARWAAAGLAAATLLLGGCAHPISLQADLSAFSAAPAAPRIERRVGLAIPEADRQREVTSGGGGGDSVRYFPYRDMETGIYAALSRVFANVVRLPSTAAQGVDYVVTVSIATTSSSPSLLTWPPTRFSVDLSCRFADPAGRTVREVRVRGEGQAEFSEFKGNMGLAGQRAVQDALARLAAALAEPAWKDL